MAKKVAVLAVNPVNGCGLFQYLEAFFENGISYKVFAVSNTKEIRTNSGIALIADDVIANLKGHEDEFDAMVFSCGDAIPQFAQHANEPYNQDLMAVIAAFGQKGKIMSGHCAGAMLFDMQVLSTERLLLSIRLLSRLYKKERLRTTSRKPMEISIRPKMKIVSGH